MAKAVWHECCCECCALVLLARAPDRAHPADSSRATSHVPSSWHVRAPLAGNAPRRVSARRARRRRRARGMLRVRRPRAGGGAPRGDPRFDQSHIGDPMAKREVSTRAARARVSSHHRGSHRSDGHHRDARHRVSVVERRASETARARRHPRRRGFGGSSLPLRPVAASGAKRRVLGRRRRGERPRA